MGTLIYPSSTFHMNIFLHPLFDQIKNSKKPEEKLLLLQQTEGYRSFLSNNGWIEKCLGALSEREKVAVASLLALEQGERLFGKEEKVLKKNNSSWEKLLLFLCELEQFYQPIGGIIGYQSAFCALLAEENESAQKKEKDKNKEISWRLPPLFDLNKDKKLAKEAVLWGIDSLPIMSEIYLVGGAAERLNFVEKKGHHRLPAALLPFYGRSLLESLVRDLQGREYLYFKLYGTQLVTPIGLMTSHEYGNDQYIRNFCSSKNWFGRPSNSFRCFSQPMVPVITEEGNWIFSKPLCPEVKPGGHGVVWKLAKEEALFQWFKELGRQKVLVRQINNPIGGSDNGLLALSGLGCHDDKSFGFATCEPLTNAAEGVIVQCEVFDGKKYSYFASNIEYIRWQKGQNKKEAPDCPPSSSLPGESSFPANSNILFASIDAIERAIERLPFPGLLINMKSHHEEKNEQSQTTYRVKAGRLESTMQNITDEMITEASHKLDEQELRQLPCFATFNARGKTISVTKRAFKPGENAFETPQKAFYDLLTARYELLKEYCNFSLPPFCDLDSYLTAGPSFLFDYHPALGPLYSIISQKIVGGVFENYSELQLEISEIFINNLYLSGSLIILAENCLGSGKRENPSQAALAKPVNENKPIAYGDKQGSCILKNVQVKNKGFNRELHQNIWKGEIIREEAVRIMINGDGEFVAEDVIFEGSHTIIVPEGFRVTAYTSQEGEVRFEKKEISQPSWSWKYCLAPHDSSRPVDRPVDLCFTRR